MIYERDDQWFRQCPDCLQEISGSNKYNVKAADDKGRKCRDCSNRSRPSLAGENNPFYGKKHTLEAKAAISKANSGKVHSDETREKHRKNLTARKLENPDAWVGGLKTDYWIARYGEEEAQRRLIEQLNKWSLLSSGENNPMFGKPAPGGSGYGWKGFYKGTFFRSLRELRFMLDNPSAKSAETNNWRAFFTYEGRKRSTIADFVLEENKQIIECKPGRLHETKLVQAKFKAIKALADSRGFTAILVDPGIVDYQDLTQLIENGTVVLQPKTLEIYKKWQK